MKPPSVLVAMLVSPVWGLSIPEVYPGVWSAHSLSVLLLRALLVSCLLSSFADSL